MIENIQSSTSLSFSGEEKRAPHGRSLEEPQPIAPTATTTLHNTASPYSHLDKGRQVNPDIQDIITGIVKLLNGNVNVQANTVPAMGRPIRPLSSRINNRGPPRINDLPALPPDFDVPAPPLPPPPLGQMPPPAPSMTSNRLPTPYPFDLPPPSSAPVRPYGDHMTGNKRPGIYRPTVIPPWNNRLTQRRPGNRRPNPIPAYKPLPSDYISLTTDKPMDDIFNLDLGSHLGNEHEGGGSEENVTTKSQEEITTVASDLPEVTTNITESSETVDRETMEFEKNKEKITKKDKYSAKTTSVTPTVPLPSSVDASSSADPSPSNPTQLTTDLIQGISNQTVTDFRTKEQFSDNTDVVATPTEDGAITPTPILNITSFGLIENVTEMSSSAVLESSVPELLQTSKEDMLENPSNFKTPTSELLSVASISSSINSTSAHTSKSMS